MASKRGESAGGEEGWPWSKGGGEWFPSVAVETPSTSCLKARVELLRMRRNKVDGKSEILVAVLPTAEGIQHISHGGALAGIMIESCLLATRLDESVVVGRENVADFELSYRRPVPLMRFLRVEVAEVGGRARPGMVKFRLALFSVEQDDLKCNEAAVGFWMGEAKM